MKRTSTPIALLLSLAVASRAVPLENWRLPFYLIGSQRGDFTGSPSGTFWDDLSVPPALDSSLWPDSAAYNASHWTVEPSLGFAASNQAFSSGKNTNLHFDLLSDIRYKNLSVRNVLDVDQGYKSDPGFIWHKQRVAAGRIEEAYVQYRRPAWFVRFGRMNRTWGPMPDRSLVLSNNPFSYDGLEWQVSAPFFEFRHFVAAFPLRGSEVDAFGTNGAGIQVNRYFVAHALRFMVAKWASFGITETVVFARTQGMPDLQYINPFSIYAVVNTNQEAYAWNQGGGNLVLAFDARVHPFTEAVLLWGQVAFDDFQVDNAQPLDQEPTHWGFDVGMSWKDPVPAGLPFHAALRYRYLSKWIYTVHPGNTAQGERYTYVGRSLGFPLIDGDELEASGTLLGRNYWAVKLGAGFARQDTVAVTTPWPVDSTNTLGYRDEEPLGQRTHVEKTIFARLSAYAYFRDYAALAVTLDNCFVRNKENVPDDSYQYDPRVQVSITCHYSNFFLRFGQRQ